MAAAKKLAIQLETVDALIVEFRKRWDFEEDDEKMIEEFKASLSAPKKGGKGKKAPALDAEGNPKKREPSPYNLFVAAQRDDIVAAGFKGKDLIKEAARRWKEHNAANGPAEPKAEEEDSE